MHRQHEAAGVRMNGHIFETVSKKERANPWARISEVATKLDVKPVQVNHPGTITAMGADGNAYDVWEVIVALLDRLDQAASK